VGIKFSDDIPTQEVVKLFKVLMDLGIHAMTKNAQQRICLDFAAACGSEHTLRLFARNPME
jgi:hypothetical protein